MRDEFFTSFLKIMAILFVSLLLYLLTEGIVYQIATAVGASRQLANLLGELVMAALVCPICYRPILRELKEKGLLREGVSLRKTVFQVILAGVCGCILFNGVALLVGSRQTASSYEVVAETLYGGNALVAALQMIVVAPLAEELLFRGVIYRGLRCLFCLFGGERRGVVLAAGASSLFFGVMHGNLLQGGYAFVLGLLLCYLCEVHQSLIGCMLFHGTANLVSFVGTKTRLLSFMFRSMGTVIFYMIVSGVLLGVCILGIERKSTVQGERNVEKRKT